MLYFVYFYFRLRIVTVTTTGYTKVVLLSFAYRFQSYVDNDVGLRYEVQLANEGFDFIENRYAIESSDASIRFIVAVVVDQIICSQLVRSRSTGRADCICL